MMINLIKGFPWMSPVLELGSDYPDRFKVLAQ